MKILKMTLLKSLFTLEKSHALSTMTEDFIAAMSIAMTTSADDGNEDTCPFNSTILTISAAKLNLLIVTTIKIFIE